MVMDLQITTGAGAAVPWVPIAQILVTAVSACTALAAATIAARAYGAGRADRKMAEIDEVTVGIVDAWKAEKAMERAGQAFDPFLKEAERARLRVSALAEMANVSHRSIWSAEIDFAVIEARRLIEDTDIHGHQEPLEAASTRIAQLRTNVLNGVQNLQVLSDSLKADLFKNNKHGERVGNTRARIVGRFARGNIAVQMERRVKSYDDLKLHCQSTEDVESVWKGNDSDTPSVT